MKKFGSKLYLGLILLFLYAPIVTLMVLSFNSSKSRAVWGGFTLDWYAQMFDSPKIMGALYNSLTIALIASVVATIIGLLACIGIPYVILSIMPRIKTASAGTYEAAQDLGASPFKAFVKVVLPELMPGIVAGFLLSFTMSLDDFVISYFVRGRGVDTLSTLIYTQVRRGIVPSMYALSTLIFVVVLVVLLVQNFAPGWIEKQAIKRKERKALKADPTNEIA